LLNNQSFDLVLKLSPAKFKKIGQVIQELISWKCIMVFKTTMAIDEKNTNKPPPQKKQKKTKKTNNNNKTTLMQKE